MDQTRELKSYTEIIAKAKDLGASLVGIANVEDLKKAPSYTVAPMMQTYDGVGRNNKRLDNLKSGEVKWPAGAKSIIVIGYAHPEEKPELDYWYGSRSPIGNKKLMQITKDLIKYFQKDYGISAFDLPYHVERGGIYLKDAAVYAGMGCIGKNNMLVTPEYGSQLRLRGLTLDIDLPSTGPTNFDPCAFCDEICKRSCPQMSFKVKIYTPQQFGRKELPGRIGDYDRTLCNIQMKEDEATAVEQNVEGNKEPIRVVKYCRACELSCPVGKA